MPLPEYHKIAVVTVSAGDWVEGKKKCINTMICILCNGTRIVPSEYKINSLIIPPCKLCGGTFVNKNWMEMPNETP